MKIHPYELEENIVLMVDTIEDFKAAEKNSKGRKYMKTHMFHYVLNNDNLLSFWFKKI